MKTTTFIISFLMISSLSIAQDGHYSLFSENPLYLNPALSGTGSETFRIGGIYRSQWQKIGAPYSNAGFFFDGKYKNFSGGFLVNQNRAGQTGYEKINALVAAAYRKPLGKGNNALSIGLQIGINQISIDPSQQTFDNQYVGGEGFNESLSPGENFINTSSKMADANIGVVYHFAGQKEKSLKGKIGLAFYHVNSPQMTTPTGSKVYVPVKTLVHGQTSFNLNSTLSLEPTAMVAFQGSASEFVLGLNLGFNMTDTSGFKLGVGTRLKDAILFNAVFKFNQVSLGLGFDYNISKLNHASGFNNAMEISMIYNIPLKIESTPPNDLDQDGIIDSKDACPNIPGYPELNGCPKDTVVQEYYGLDTDRDGISDENDLCPYEFGYLQYQGCKDTDNDGIWDHVDVCPSLPGKIESQGCPVDITGIDSDGDGVLDRFDRCVYIFGLKALDGCPDSDEDGVSDLKDECPYVKGSITNNGCPLPGDFKTGTRGEEVLIEIVEFNTDKFEIKKKYIPQLNELANIIMGHPEFTLYIEGHTDDEGSATYNIQLSQRRANAIKNFLIQRGVSSESIDIHFFGENKPKSKNSSNFGKARNRRAELILMK